MKAVWRDFFNVVYDVDHTSSSHPGSPLRSQQPPPPPMINITPADEHQMKPPDDVTVDSPTVNNLVQELVDGVPGSPPKLEPFDFSNKDTMENGFAKINGEPNGLIMNGI